MSPSYDAVVVGAGPNGLAAAVELARNGNEVLVVEGHDEVGGGTRTAELTLPGYLHDVCSAAHPFGPTSPFLSELPLADHGLEWITSPSPVAHVLDGGEAIVVDPDLDTTAALLGADGDRYVRRLRPLVDAFAGITAGVLSPLLRPPRHPLAMARFGRWALLPATRFAAGFDGERARALFAGLAAHGSLPLDRAGTTGTGLVLAVAAHAAGWPLAAGGSHAITRALAAHLESLGGKIETGRWVTRLDELPPARAVLLDVTPSQLAAMAGGSLPVRPAKRTGRWRYGPAAFKLDLAVDRPIPWANPAVGDAATVHVGGTFEEIATAEAAVWRGEVSDRPFVLLTQPSRFDPGRAPDGGHTVWAYTHVPHRWSGDATAAIESQIERFAPGFTDTIIARHVMTPADLERYNPNNVAGSIDGGVMTLGQLFARPRLSPWPHATGIDDVYLCSSSTAPGAGAHGMCGYHAARTALARSFK